MTANRYEAYETLKAEAAASLGLPPEHERVIALASLRLLHRTLTERMLGGTVVEASSLLGITEAISQLSPAPPKTPPSIEVKFVEGVTGIYHCKHCGLRNDLPDGQYTPPSSRQPDFARTIDIDAEAVHEPKALPSPIEAKPVHPNDLPSSRSWLDP